ncbi:hypothetical protein B0T16DRAFT_402631 [Cercophora newfieldiana]|uniref:Uncharacterized protein n=1 Tax=Cercophora newfieldiana TaxID=92897 RepID=A0AA39YSK2_9PEZI|nr:hypothetical protein B0T16DRAFT_402631 [Cercophora newfieldiana]
MSFASNFAMGVGIQFSIASKRCPEFKGDRSMVLDQIRRHLQDPNNEQGFGVYRKRLGGSIIVNYMYWTTFGDDLVLPSTLGEVTIKWQRLSDVSAIKTWEASRCTERAESRP